MFQDKMQTAVNGPVLHKGYIAVLERLGTSLRASWEVVVRSAATLGKDRAITCVLQPYGQPLPNSLNSQLSHGRSISLLHTQLAIYGVSTTYSDNDK